MLNAPEQASAVSSWSASGNASKLSNKSEFHGARWKYGRESRAVTASAAPQPDALAEIAAGRRPLDASVLAESGEYPIPIIADIALGRRRRHLAVNVLNRFHIKGHVNVTELLKKR